MAPNQIRSTYAKDQAIKYLDRLKIPEAQRCYDVTKLDSQTALNYLALLQKHHVVEIPFENLIIHYSPHHQVSIHPEELFKKIIGDNNGRGGYCMENNCLFGALLRTFGFTLYSGGGRVWEENNWGGWLHMVNLVTIGDTKYHVDVGFGADAPIVPMPLDRSGTVQPHIAPGEARLQWRNIPGNTDPNQRLWVYEYRQNKDSEWQMMYCYSELEFLPNDFSSMNYWTSTTHHLFFTRTIVMEKKLLDDEGKFAGNIILFGNVLKWRIHGEKTKEIVLETEADRVDAFEKYFGIRLGQAERDGIHGRASQLP